jgi:hypothetical protein
MSMNCGEFLSLYSDWHDGLVLDDELRVLLKRHWAACPSCGRLDRAFRRGILVLRNLEPHADRHFGVRLKERIRCGAALPVDAPVPSWGGRAALMLVALALTVLALDVASRRGSRVAHATPEDTPAPVVTAGAPFVTFQDRHVTVLVHTTGHDAVVPALRPRTAAFR